jgi:hypothetical protein
MGNGVIAFCNASTLGIRIVAAAALSTRVRLLIFRYFLILIGGSSRASCSYAPATGARLIASRASAIGKTAAGLLMLSSLDIVFNAPFRFIVPARIKLAVEQYHQVNTFLTGF